MTEERPAWYRESAVLRLPSRPDLASYTPERAFGASTGRGVRVAVIDSGIDADHPALGASIDVSGGVEFVVAADGSVVRRDGPHGDVYGHGTACAGIIHALAPDATITSVRVLDSSLRGRAAAFHAGLEWAVDEGFEVINLSLGAAKREWALAFHDTCDRGYFNNSFIVTAANNIRRDSFPSLFASVTSVAANSSADPLRFHFNPQPPTEFLARGVDVEVPWLGGTSIVTTGNSFAAPHIAAFAALIKAEHPELRPFQVKTALWAASANVREAITDRRALDLPHDRAATIGVDAETTLDEIATDPRLVRPATDREAIRVTLPPLSLGDPTHHGPPVPVPPAEREELREAMPDYIVGELIARGPWGPVYAASKDGRSLALRRLDPTLVADAATRTRFAVSVRIAAELHHPHILPIVELRETEYFAVVAMPRCPSNLGVARSVALAPPAVTVAAISLLRGLHVAHAAGIYHGDLRPENCLIDEHGRVVVSDVGIAASLTSELRANSAPNDPSSWSYLAPEQLEGTAIGAFTDLHAVGLLLFELLSGTFPFEPVASLGALVGQRARQRPRSLGSLAPDAPPWLAAIVDRAVATDPASRPRSADAMADELDDGARAAWGSEWTADQPFRLDAQRMAE